MKYGWLLMAPLIASNIYVFWESTRDPKYNKKNLFLGAWLISFIIGLFSLVR